METDVFYQGRDASCGVQQAPLASLPRMPPPPSATLESLDGMDMQSLEAISEVEGLDPIELANMKLDLRRKGAQTFSLAFCR